MELLDSRDSLDLQANDKKSKCMRSWYLYEQYKALQRHQLDAAEKLKNRSYQERLLHRELSEHRARRRLYGKSGLGPSEPQVECSLKSHDDAFNSTAEDFYETLCEFHNDFETEQEYVAENNSTTDSDIDKAYMEDFKSFEGQDATLSSRESIASVIEKVDDVGSTNKSFTEKLEQVQKNIAESLTLQLEAVKENMLCLEKYVCLSEAEKSSEEESVHSEERSIAEVQAPGKTFPVFDRNMFTMWSRLVSFAYQVMQLNHGNCYYDYSSQLMTAVLACDVLRRGVNRMCDILQPYVSPIKFEDASDVGSVVSYKSLKRKNSHMPKKPRKSSEYQTNSSVHKAVVKRHSVRNNCSENLWQRCSKYSFENKCGRMPRRSSEPLKGGKGRSSGSSDSLWPRDLESEAHGCHCYACHKKVINPMLKLVWYLDQILTSDIDDFVFK